MESLKINLWGIEFSSPVWTASGTFGFGIEFEEFLDLNKVGAICVKGISLKPREGNPPPRIWETPCGMLNSIGIQNPGVEEFVLKILPKLEKYACKVIVNIYGETIEEYVEVAKVLNGCKKVSALEINASCPNVNKGGMAFGVDPVESAKLVESVKSVTDKPVIFKLTPNVSDPTEIAKAVEKAGADGISAINTLLGMAIDIEKKKPRLAKVFGGLSGPAIKPVALRIVYQVANSVKVPVIGIGGISDWKDAVEFFLAGASAVQVGTANFYNPKVVVEINEGLSEYLKRHGYNNISELVGDLRI